MNRLKRDESQQTSRRVSSIVLSSAAMSPLGISSSRLRKSRSPREHVIRRLARIVYDSGTGTTSAGFIGPKRWSTVVAAG